MKAITLFVVLACFVAPAEADSEIVRGDVVKVEDKEIYIDVGAQRGIASGQPLRIKRPIKLQHPITRAMVDDWIPIASATVTQAAGSLSRAVVGDVVDGIRPGDIAEVLVVGAEPARMAPVGRTGDPEVAEVLRVFAAMTGASIDARIAAWERYLSSRPQTRFAPAIRADIDTLRGLREQQRAPASAQLAEPVGTVEHAAPADAAPGVALPLVFVLTEPERVASAYLHYRVAGNRTYKRVLLTREHDIYLRGVVPGDAVQPPGLEYFVELSTPVGRSGLAIGGPDAPKVVEVAPPPLINRFDAAPGRSSVTLAGDYLDFATFDKRTGDHHDRMTIATVDFTYRMDRYVESLGVGYGIYDGTGGSANAIWSADTPAPTSGFRFGYADIEVGGQVDTVHVSAGGQVIAGVGKTGFGMGGEGRLRIGDRDGTHLVLSGRSVDQVGFLSEIEFAAHPVEHILVGVSVGATDQPTQGDVGVKLGTELQLVRFRRISVTARGSWQGRSIAHGGLGGGAGLGFHW